VRQEKSPLDLRKQVVSRAFGELTVGRPASSLRFAPSSRSGGTGAPSGAPWESRKVDWAHLVVRSGQLTGRAGGEARKAPKPNERGYLREFR
jgi:hypothetical protein